MKNKEQIKEEKVQLWQLLINDLHRTTDQMARCTNLKQASRLFTRAAVFEWFGIQVYGQDFYKKPDEWEKE